MLQRPNRRTKHINLTRMHLFRICVSGFGGLPQSYDQGPIMIDPEHLGISEIAVQHFHGLIQKALDDVGGNV